MEKIPILRMGDLLLVTLQMDLDDRLVLRLQDDLSELIVQSGASRVLIDISTVEIVDSYMASVLADIASIASLLDARTVVAGMRPAVAITLVELGLTLDGVRTALTVERAMEILGVKTMPRVPLAETGE